MLGSQFDLSNDPEESAESQEATQKRFLGIQFACCGVYARIYLNKDAQQYVGCCPKCSRRISFRVGPGGTDHRFFTVP